MVKNIIIQKLFETEETPTANRRIDYIYAEGRVVAARVYENGNGHLYYVLADHLGSWERVLDGSRNTVQKTHFDPWGNRMDFNAWATPQTQTSFLFDRGFTGHEHHDFLHVINANARLYDPVIGRFFSPDPFVQAPDLTQNYNRYSYCMNNPVMYSDPDGELFGTISGLVSDVFYNLFLKSDQDEGWDWSRTENGWRIDMGLLETDPNKSGWGRFWEVVSRFTWQLPQTSTGYLFNSTLNNIGMVNNVTYGCGMTAVDSDLDIGAVTLGNYSTGSTGYTADWRDHMFVHEYGHYIQSQQHGPLYLVTVGVPSVQSAILSNVSHGKINHHERWFEADASYKGSDYFDKYFGSGKEGYIADSPFYFDKNSFANKYHSPYINPMTNDNTQNNYPIYGKFHWTDIPIYIPIIGLFPCLLYL